MKLTQNVHLLRKDFHVTPTVKRYVNIYVIIGEQGCYLVDSGVAGTEKLIQDYLKSAGKSLADVKGIFLTHSHPDHIGAAAEIKRQSDCKIFAPFLERDWIEDIQKQFKERPIPNFFELLPESVKIDYILNGGETLILEDALEMRALHTPGHSHGSMSYILNNEIIFMGDAIPVPNDLPIFTNYEKSIQTINQIQSLSQISLFCPAWDNAYTRENLDDIMDESRKMLINIKQNALSVYQTFKTESDEERVLEILKRTGLLPYAGNPLIAKSIASCLTDF